MDPEQSTIYLQSLAPQTCELHLLFSMLVSVPRLERVPTLKDVIRDLAAGDRLLRACSATRSSRPPTS